MARDRATRARFASDLLNLTLAAPGLNRHEKGGKDAAEWLPARNRCWFAATVVAVWRAYGLTIDRREATVMEPAGRGAAPEGGGLNNAATGWCVSRRPVGVFVGPAAAWRAA